MQACDDIRRLVIRQGRLSELRKVEPGLERCEIIEEGWLVKESGHRGMHLQWILPI
jgi:hypothetical protein